MIGDNPAFLEAAPQFEGVAEYVAARGFETEFLASAACYLACLEEGNFRPFAESDIAEASIDAEAKDPCFGAGWLNAKRQAETIRNRIPPFLRS